MATATIDDDVEPVMKIEDIIYPMYIPEATSLSSQNKLNKEIGERIMLTFKEKTIYFSWRNWLLKKKNWQLFLPMVNHIW